MLSQQIGWLPIRYAYFILTVLLESMEGIDYLNKTVNRESPVQFENRIKPRVYVRHITLSTMYEKAPFCYRNWRKGT